MQTLQLFSERLIQTKFVPEDYEDFKKLEMNYEVMKYIQGEASDENRAAEKFVKVMGINAQHVEFGFCCVRNRFDNSFIGLSKITAYADPENPENPNVTCAEVGYSMLPEFWGKGIASEIASRLIAYAKELGSINKLFGLVDPENAASIKVLTKFGFKFYQNGLWNNLPSATYKLDLK